VCSHGHPSLELVIVGKILHTPSVSPGSKNMGGNLSVLERLYVAPYMTLTSRQGGTFRRTFSTRTHRDVIYSFCTLSSHWVLLAFRHAYITVGLLVPSSSSESEL